MLLRHGREPMRTGAPQQLEEQRLGLVVGVMRERNNVHVGFGERRVSGRAGGCLHARAAGTLDAHALHRYRNGTLCAFVDAELRPAIGIRGKTVVNVHSAERDTKFGGERGEGVEKYDRVAAPGERDSDPGRMGSNRALDGNPRDCIAGRA